MAAGCPPAAHVLRFDPGRYLNSLSLPVIPLTIAVSLCLVFTFVVFFLREQSRRFSNAERESLLPLAEETPRVAGRAGVAQASPPASAAGQAGTPGLLQTDRSTSSSSP